VSASSGRKTLLIKLGALGDVVRTTPLLRRLGGRVTWVTARGSLPLLRGLPGLERALAIDDARGLSRERFELVINLDEDDAACRLATAVDARHKAGPRFEGKRKVYCRASAPLFDRSLISRLGRRRADALKLRGRLTYQQLAFRAAGLRFRGEEPLLPPRPAARPARLIGLETRVGERWPAKAWDGWAQVERQLRARGWGVRRLSPRPTIERYLKDIEDCAVVAAGDTLAMHAALALGKPTVALFLVTSPAEIHGYGRLTKLVHPDLARHFYRTGRVPGLSKGISAERVVAAVLRAAKA
jgi:heptosyltransferase-2